IYDVSKYNMERVTNIKDENFQENASLTGSLLVRSSQAVGNLFNLFTFYGAQLVGAIVGAILISNFVSDFFLVVFLFWSFITSYMATRPLRKIKKGSENLAKRTANFQQLIIRILNSYNLLKYQRRFSELIDKYNRSLSRWSHIGSFLRYRHFKNALIIFFMKSFLILFTIFLYFLNSDKFEVSVALMLLLVIITLSRTIEEFSARLFELTVNIGEVVTFEKIINESEEENSSFKENLSIINLESIEVSDLYLKRGEFKIINDLSFEAKKGMLLAVIGESGAGKTSLLKFLVGMHEACNAKVFYNGNLITNENKHFLSRIFHYTDLTRINLGQSLNSDFRDLAGCRNMSEFESQEKSLHLEKLPNNWKTSMNLQLSKGQFARVELMLAMSTGKSLLLDEPTSALDDEVCGDVMTALRNYGQLVIFSTHDKRAISKADIVINLLGDGNHEVSYSS
ncbi:ABC transporter ATP-binding protein, partial [Vibrio penaeicida]|uniref:ABC transporter ATP-binding protein n=1 Tax=Vibrio penaeicida TaxID=104609 RepID=UPI001F2BE43C